MYIRTLLNFKWPSSAYAVHTIHTHIHTCTHAYTQESQQSSHTHNNRLRAFFRVCSTSPSCITHPWDRHIQQTHLIHICAHSHTHELVWMQASLCCAKEPYKIGDILQKRPVISSIILTVATPYWMHVIARSKTRTNTHTEVARTYYRYEWAMSHIWMSS